MTHDNHATLPGYDPDQLLHDGCAECEERGADPGLAIAYLDHERFGRAWERAATLQARGLPGGSRAELPMLRILAAVEVQLERRGLPLGVLP